MEMNNSKIKKYIGVKIKEMRTMNGLSQEQIARLLKLSRVSIINAEQGKHALKYDSLLLLCGLFKCTPNDLFPAPSVKKFKVQEKYVIVKKKVRIIKSC